MRNQALGLLGKLFSRSSGPGALSYALSGDPQLAAFVGTSVGLARQLVEVGLRHPIGKQLVEATLKAGRAIGGPELGMLMQIGRHGKAPAGSLDMLREPPRTKTEPLGLDELERRLGTPTSTPQGPQAPTGRRVNELYEQSYGTKPPGAGR